MPVLLINKRAKFDYTILESYQAGLSLSSRMVKAIRANKISLDGKYIILQRGKLIMLDMGTDEWRENITLLLNKKEIQEIARSLATDGVTCVPLNFKSVGRWLKADIAIVRGKKKHDKREAIKKRDIERDIRRGLEA